MLFSDLTRYFEQLEETSSRLKLIDILAELFKQVKQDEVKEVSYLIQGRVAPFYEATEIGMSEKYVASSMSKVWGVDRDEILKEYGRSGDLGKVAQRHAELVSASRSRSEFGMTVREVFETLKEIANTSGEGSVDKKINLLSDLLKQVDSISAKHLVRIPLGTSRLGIGDPTVLDGFALAKLGDRSQRKVLEGAYNKVSDLGLIGEVLWSQGVEGIEKMDVTVGRPIRSQLCERISEPQLVLDKYGGEAHVQYKYDGFRVQIHKDGETVRLFSRNLEETTLMFPDIIAGVLSQVKAKTAIFDSEALAYSPESEEFLPFQETTKRRRKHGIEEAQKSLPLKAFVFDVMYLNRKSLVDTPLNERIKILEDSIQGDEVLVKQPGEFTKEARRIQELFDDALTQGLEGLIIKRPDSKYEAGARNFNWIKMKRHTQGELKDTVDCVILGYIYGRGKRADFGAGALLVGLYDKKADEFVSVCKIGTGLTDEEWREIHKRADKIKVDHKPARVNSIITPSVWVEPEIVIEVLADEITKSPNHTAGKTDTTPGYALRFPRLVRFRDDDRKAEDATTVEELIKMYNQQYKKN